MAATYSAEILDGAVRASARGELDREAFLDKLAAAGISTYEARLGDRVVPGQQIARMGSTGRSTGPHLHVELLSQGRPVDPGDLLKQARGDADWMAYRSESSEHSE